MFPEQTSESGADPTPDRDTTPHDAPDRPISGSTTADNALPIPTWLRWVGVAATIYLLICAVGIIGDGFKGLGADTAEGLFDFATNPFIALFVGILVTSIVQSSSTTTSIVVAAVGSGAMPLSVGIPMIMGANIGTSVTNTLASLGHVGDKDEFRRAFATSTVHDFFNLLAVVILLPLELLFHPLERASGWVADQLSGVVAPDPDSADIISILTDPVVDTADGVTSWMGQTPGAIAMIVLGVILIFVSVRTLGKILQVLMVGRAREILHKAVGSNPAVSMGAGTLVTVLVQSSSVTTSVMVPFAGSGSLTLRQIYPMTLGANIGTTFTALLAALALAGGDGAEIALQTALVHLGFNLLGIFLIYVIPLLRNVPPRLAETLAAISAERKWVAAVWVLTVFLAIPALAILVKIVVS